VREGSKRRRMKEGKGPDVCLVDGMTELNEGPRGVKRDDLHGRKRKKKKKRKKRKKRQRTFYLFVGGNQLKGDRRRSEYK